MHTVIRQMSISDACIQLFGIFNYKFDLKLSSGRCSGCDEPYAEYSKLSGAPCATHLTLCFSMMLILASGGGLVQPPKIFFLK